MIQSSPTTTDCTLDSAVQFNVGKCDGRGMCGAVPVAKDRAVTCEPDSTPEGCDGDSVCMEGACYTNITKCAPCEDDSNLCTVGSCNAAGACVETKVDCSSVVPVGVDGSCQFPVCFSGTVVCEAHPANEGALCFSFFHSMSLLLAVATTAVVILVSELPYVTWKITFTFLSPPRWHSQ